MKQNLLAALMILVLLAIGCSRTPGIESKTTNNNKIPVVLLFEHDGCKVYRFDDGRYGYFTKCGPTSWSYTERCGKNCSHTVDVTNPVVP
jgi:hypothetical protein